MTNPGPDYAIPAPNSPELGPSPYAELGTEAHRSLETQFQAAVYLAEVVHQHEGRLFIMGGYARDEALRQYGHPVESQDIDIEIFGLEEAKVRELLEGFSPGVKQVGKRFGVFISQDLEISIPRRDTKTGPGHRGFQVDADPFMSIKEATSRRDFTINALALDPRSGEIIDEHNGLGDMKEGLLRATDPESFGDDPLRALRAVQLTGRFGLQLEPSTAALCREQNLSELPASRIGQEWRKLLLLSTKPSVGLEVARQIGVIDQLHPELAALDGTLQEPDWHPEGDVWTHTLMTLDCAAQIARREKLEPNDALILLLASLLHDTGKPETTVINNATRQIESPKHDIAGIKPTESFLESLAIPKAMAAKVSRLVRNHMFLTNHPEPTDRAVSRLADRLHPATVQELVRVAEADSRGRDLPWHGFAKGAALVEQAARLDSLDSAPKPLVRGRDLIEWGEKPGPHFNTLLQKLYSAQLDGKITSLEEARSYLTQAS